MPSCSNSSSDGQLGPDAHAMTTADIALVRRWRVADQRRRLLQVIQPALIGLIDGRISTLAPIFAVAYVVSIELVVIAWVRKRFLGVALRTSLVQITLGGLIVAAVGVIVGHA